MKTISVLFQFYYSINAILFNTIQYNYNMYNNLFYYCKRNHLYSKPIEVNKVEDKALYLPLIVDTEFVSRSYPYLGKYGGSDFTLTVQVKGINAKPQIFLHKEAYALGIHKQLVDTINIPLFSSEFNN